MSRISAASVSPVLERLLVSRRLISMGGDQQAGGDDTASRLVTHQLAETQSKLGGFVA